MIALRPRTHHRRPAPPAGPLTGIKVLDVGTVYAAPITAMLLGDLGADVVKVEHPKGDPARTHGSNRDGHGLWWKVIARNKRAITLNFGKPEGADMLRRLVADADVLVENFRPGVMEKWGLGPDVLLDVNPRLIMLRVTGFGQTGPYAQRRAFGTLMEAMSGFAHQTGQEDGPPTLPPFGLADGVAGITGAFAVTRRALPARRARPRHRTRPGDRPRRCSSRCSGSSGPGPRCTTSSVIIAGPARQQVAEQRPAQRLPHPRRPLGGHLGQRHLGRRAGHAAGRAGRPDREAVVRLGRGAQPAPRDARRRGGRSGSPPAISTRSCRPSRRPAPRWRPIYDVEQLVNDPQVIARDTITTVDDEDLGDAEDAEPDVPAGRHPGRHPVGRPPARPGQRAGLRRARRRRRRSSPAARRRASSDGTAATCSRRGTTPSCSTGCSPPGPTR